MTTINLNVEGRNINLEAETKKSFVELFVNKVVTGDIVGDYEDMTVSDLREAAADLWDEQMEVEAAAASSTTTSTDVEVKVTVSGVKKAATGAF